MGFGSPLKILRGETFSRWLKPAFLSYAALKRRSSTALQESLLSLASARLNVAFIDITACPTPNGQSPEPEVQSPKSKAQRPTNAGGRFLRRDV